MSSVNVISGEFWCYKTLLSALLLGIPILINVIYVVTIRS